MRFFRSLAAVGASALLLLLCMPAPASEIQAPLPDSEASPAQRMHVGRRVIRVELLDAQGAPVPLPLVAGVASASLKEGSQYRLRLTNLTQGRLSVVVSVDGLDPARGNRAYLGQPGVVLQPGETRVLAHSRQAPDAPPGAFLPGARKQGEIALKVFLERKDYPTQMPGVAPAPFSPEYFRVTSAGDREWLPPKGYPFRRLSREPAEAPYLKYRVRSPAPAIHGQR